MTSLQQRIAQVEDSIVKACRDANRPRHEVSLIAVSKTHPVELLLEAAEAGLTTFGENRVQEFATKSSALTDANYTVVHTKESLERGLQIHLIGHLQSNKSVRAVELFSAVDTVDSLRLAQRLNEAAKALNLTLPILLEIKLSHEATKEGLAPNSSELSELLAALPAFENLHPRGLMTIAPFDSDPAIARACFRSLATLRNDLTQQHPRLSLQTLSMGMSGDFAEAIAEGSTEIRIGTAIFGTRPKPE